MCRYDLQNLSIKQWLMLCEEELRHWLVWDVCECVPSFQCVVLWSNIISPSIFTKCYRTKNTAVEMRRCRYRVWQSFILSRDGRHCSLYLFYLSAAVDIDHFCVPHRSSVLRLISTNYGYKVRQTAGVHALGSCGGSLSSEQLVPNYSKIKAS